VPVGQDQEYWAALPTDEVGRAIIKRVEEYYGYIRKVGRLSLWRRSYDYFYQSLRTGGRVYYTGEVDEYTNTDVADYRNILLHLKQMTTSQRPAFEARAVNTDHKSEAQVTLAEGLLDYYLKEKQLERYTDKCVEYALTFGDGYVELFWDATAGDEYTVEKKEDKESVTSLGEPGEIRRQGELLARTYNPLDVIIDYTLTSDIDHDWWVTRKFKNRYSLAAKHPELKDEILNTSMAVEEKDTVFGMQLTEPSDMIPVYTMYHRRNEALPDGRIVEMVSADAILAEGPLPYKDVSIYKMSPGTQTGTPFGYSVAFDLLPLQEALNALYSTVATNQANFGVQNIAVPLGHNISITAITDGLNLIEYDPKLGKPEALNLTATPPEIFNFITMIEKKMETISGVNSVTRGNPESSLKSGAALALVQSTAISFNSELQRSYAQLMEDVGTGIINILKDYAKTDRVAQVVGKANKSLMKEWTGDDLTDINRVTVDLGNPLTRTTAGKVNMAEQLLQAGMVENPDQYLQVLTTGKIEPLIEGKRAEMLNIKAENEELSEGNPVPAIFTDNHAMHIMEHKAVIASPDARRDEGIVKSVTEHMQEHLNLLQSTDPNMLLLMGQQPVQAPPPPGPAQPNEGPAAGNVPEGLIPAVGEGGPAAEAAGISMPSQPQMPENPLTGKQFDPVTGGL